MPSSAWSAAPRVLHSFPTRRSSDLFGVLIGGALLLPAVYQIGFALAWDGQTLGKRLLGTRVYDVHGGAASRLQHVLRGLFWPFEALRSEEHTSELQSLRHLVCRLLLGPPPPVSYTLSLHDALPICSECSSEARCSSPRSTRSASPWRGTGRRSANGCSARACTTSTAARPRACSTCCAGSSGPSRR